MARQNQRGLFDAFDGRQEDGLELRADTPRIAPSGRFSAPIGAPSDTLADRQRHRAATLAALHDYLSRAGRKGPKMGGR